MKSLKGLAQVGALVLPLTLLVSPTVAQDKLKVAIGQINNWENQVPTLGMAAGIFQNTNSSWKILARKARVRRSSRLSPARPTSASGWERPARCDSSPRARRCARRRRIHWQQRSVLVCARRSPNQEPEGYHREPDRRLLHQRFEFEQHRARFRQSARRQGKPTATGGPPATFTQVMSGRSTSAGGATARRRGSASGQDQNYRARERSR